MELRDLTTQVRTRFLPTDEIQGEKMVQPRVIHLAFKCCVNTTNMEDMQSIC